MIDLAPIREKWLEERPTYEELAFTVAEYLRVAARRRGLACKIEHRSKELASLLKKCVIKEYGYDQVGDKAGVRVIVSYSGLLPKAEEVINDVLAVDDRDDKSSKLGYDQLGYLGVHFQAHLPEQANAGQLGKFTGLACEVQLHTRAQNLWADTAHDLSYKAVGELPVAVNRAIYRLVALAEIYDVEISDARGTILTAAGYEEARLLERLEGIYYGFTAAEFNRDFSLRILSELKPLFAADVDAYSARLEEFARRNAEKITGVYSAYAADERAVIFLTQPEGLVILYELEEDPFRLADHWVLPVGLLQHLGAVWGVDVTLPGKPS